MMGIRGSGLPSRTQLLWPKFPGRWYYTPVKVAKVLSIFIWQKKQPSPLTLLLTLQPAIETSCICLIDTKSHRFIHPFPLCGVSPESCFIGSPKIPVIPSILFWTMHPSNAWSGVSLKEYFMRLLQHPVFVLQDFVLHHSSTANP